jgi:hypothetical protein
MTSGLSGGLISGPLATKRVFAAPNGGALIKSANPSAASSSCLELQVAGVKKFQMNRQGYMAIGDPATALGYICGPGTPLDNVTGYSYLLVGNDVGLQNTANGRALFLRGAATNPINIDTTVGLHFGPYGSTSGEIVGPVLNRAGSTTTLQIGQDHATSPTAQTIKAHNVTTGTGASLTLSGGTGSVANGAVVLNGGNRAAYNAAPDAATIRDILISHGLMAES